MSAKSNKPRTARKVGAKKNQKQQAPRRARRRNNARTTRTRGGQTVTTTRTVHGQGGYFSDNGGKLGSWLGGQGGKLAGGLLDRVFGLGAYNVKSNSLVSMDSVRYQPGGPPRVINAKKGEATVMAHREFVHDIISSADVDASGNTVFKIEEWALNPGNSDLFPWLSLMAQGFQEYKINGMLVELISESSTFAQNLALGSVMMSADYNPLAVPPANKVAMLELEYSSACKTSDNIIMPVECAMQNDSETHLFIALDSDYQGTDARTFDLGKIYIASQGQPAASAKIAEMWVTYEVFFYKPKVPNFAFGAVGAHFTMSGCVTATPLNNAVLQPGSDEGFEVNSSIKRLYFPLGKSTWMVSISWAAGVMAGLVRWSLSGGAGVTFKQLFSSAVSNNSTSFSSSADTAAYTSTIVFIVQITDAVNPCWITITGGALPLACYGDIMASKFPDAILTDVESGLADIPPHEYHEEYRSPGSRRV